MASGGGVEHDVVEAEGGCRVAQQLCKLVKRRDFDSTGPGKLLFHARHGLIRQHPPIGTHHTFPIGMRCLLGVNIQGVEPRNLRHGAG